MLNKSGQNTSTFSEIDILAGGSLPPLFWEADRQGVTSAWWTHVPFAHWLMSVSEPRIVVELGSHFGVSYFAFCQAAQRLGLASRCFAVDTWEGDVHAGQYQNDVYLDVKLHNDLKYAQFSSLLRCKFDDAVDKFAPESIDILHIDGLHTYDACKHDFETWQGRLSDRAVVLFHDVNEFRDDFGVWKVWAELQERFPSFTFLHGHGLGVLAVGENVPAQIRMLCDVSDPTAQNNIREAFAYIGQHWQMKHQIYELDRDLRSIKAQPPIMSRAIRKLRRMISV